MSSCLMRMRVAHVLNHDWQLGCHLGMPAVSQLSLPQGLPQPRTALDRRPYGHTQSRPEAG